MTPAHVHISLATLSNAGAAPINTVGAPTTHGAGVTGMHGIGVKTPNAAAVAAATVGFAIELHIPNGRILSIGTLSRMVATGVAATHRFTGSTVRLLGAAPKLHCNIAPIQTAWGILSASRALRVDDRRAGAQFPVVVVEALLQFAGVAVLPHLAVQDARMVVRHRLGLARRVIVDRPP